jgi:hypothetical protein
MRIRQAWRPVRAAGGTPIRQAQRGALNQDFRRGRALYRRFNRFGPTRAIRVRHPRLVPPVVVELGDLVGLIYRSDKWQTGRPRAYIHFMQDPPRLVSNVEGTQLYIVGGSYRVAGRGIEG